MPPIITSLLDTDLYKFTMWQALLHQHPQTQAECELVCRNTPAYPLADLLDEVNAELDHLCQLRFMPDFSGVPAPGVWRQRVKWQATAFVRRYGNESF